MIYSTLILFCLFFPAADAINNCEASTDASIDFWWHLLQSKRSSSSREGLEYLAVGVGVLSRGGWSILQRGLEYLAERVRVPCRVPCRDGLD